MPIIAPIPRDERRLIQKAIHKTHDKNHARRLTAMLMLQRVDSVSSRSAVPVHLWDDGLTGLHCMVLKDWFLCLPVAGVNGRLNRFVRC